MRGWLRAAAIYNLVWGAFVVLFPGALFDWTNADAPRYPGVWQCVGMIVGVYGIGYAIASTNPLRHWPIVLVGLLGKVLGPIGFAFAATRGEFPAAFGWTILTNDLIWWVPFAAILRSAYADWRRRDEWLVSSAPPPEAVMIRARSSTGETLADLSFDRPRLVVFLRHSGCTFCRETLAELERIRPELERRGVGIVLVTQSDPASARGLFAHHGLAEVPIFSDPALELYRSFRLRRGRISQLFGPRIWWRGIAAALRGHRIGRLDGDGFRMPGSFVVADGRVVLEHRSDSAADRPDYVALAARASDPEDAIPADDSCRLS
jgi:hypothetical protein